MQDNGQGPVVVHTPQEIGKQAVIETPVGEIRAIWLGSVSDGKSLARAMQTMAKLERDRRGGTLDPIV